MGENCLPLEEDLDLAVPLPPRTWWGSLLSLLSRERSGKNKKKENSNLFKTYFCGKARDEWGEKWTANTKNLENKLWGIKPEQRSHIYYQDHLIGWQRLESVWFWINYPQLSCFPKYPTHSYFPPAASASEASGLKSLIWYAHEYIRFPYFSPSFLKITNNYCPHSPCIPSLSSSDSSSLLNTAISMSS